MVVIGRGADMMGHQPDDRLGGGRMHHRIGRDPATIQRIEPDPAAAIDHDLDHRRILERLAHETTQAIPKRLGQAILSVVGA